MISLFKPKKIKDFKPKGLKIYTFNAGFKKDNYVRNTFAFSN